MQYVLPLCVFLTYIGVPSMSGYCSKSSVTISSGVSGGMLIKLTFIRRLGGGRFFRLSG